MFKWKRRIAIVLALTMVLSLVPPLGLSVEAAAPRVTIDSLYTSTTMPTDLNKIPRLTTPTVNIAGTLQNVDPDQIGNLYYTIIQMDTSGNTIASQRVDNNKATMPTNSSYQFNNVQLYEGLNKVIVSYAGGSTQNSVPAWVFYNAVPLISDLTVDDLPFDDGVRAPQTSTAAELITIRGKGNNLTSVTIKKLGSNEEVQARIDQRSGEFFISAGVNKLNSPDVLSLEPGDNKLLIVAKGEGNNVYQLERTLIFNYGSYAYNGTLQREKGNKELFSLTEHPYISFTSADDLAFILSSRLKVDLENNRLKYPYLDLYLNGNKYQTYNLDQNVQTALQVNEMLPNKVTTKYNGSLVFYGQGFTSLGSSKVSIRVLKNGNVDHDVATQIVNDEVLVSEKLGLSYSKGDILSVEVLLDGTTISTHSLRVVEEGEITYKLNKGTSSIEKPVVLIYDTELSNTTEYPKLSFGSSVSILNFRNMDGTYVNPQLNQTANTEHALKMDDYHYLQGNYMVDVKLENGNEILPFPVIFVAPRVEGASLKYNSKDTEMIVPGSSGTKNYQLTYDLAEVIGTIQPTQFQVQVLDQNGHPVSPAISLTGGTVTGDKLKYTIKNELDGLTPGTYQLQLQYGEHIIYKSDVVVGYPEVGQVSPNQLYMGYVDTPLTLYGEKLDLLGLAAGANTKLELKIGDWPAFYPTIVEVDPEGNWIKVTLPAGKVNRSNPTGWKTIVSFNGHPISQDSQQMLIHMKEPVVGSTSNPSGVQGNSTTLMVDNHYAYFYADPAKDTNLYTDQLVWYVEGDKTGKQKVDASTVDVKVSDTEISVNVSQLLSAAFTATGKTFNDNDRYYIYFTYGAGGKTSDQKYMITRKDIVDTAMVYSYDVKSPDPTDATVGKSYVYLNHYDSTKTNLPITLYGANLTKTYSLFVDGKTVADDTKSSTDGGKTILFSVPTNTVGVHFADIRDEENNLLYSFRYEVKLPPLDYESTIGTTQVFGLDEFVLTLPSKGVHLEKLLPKESLTYDNGTEQISKLQAHILQPLPDGTYRNLRRTFTYKPDTIKPEFLTLTASGVAGIAPGQYRLLITYGKDVSTTSDYMDYNVLPGGQLLPFEVVAPQLVSISSNQSAQMTGATFSFNGINLAQKDITADKSDYLFYLVTSNGVEQRLNIPATSIEAAGNQLTISDVDLSTFKVDAYTFRVKYKNQTIGDFPFRITGNDATIRYNAQYSSDGSFNVYDFRVTGFKLPADKREQTITFVFRNAAGETVKKEYSFIVESQSNVYVESVNVTNVGPLNPDGNLLTESPITFEVKVKNADANTKVNLYLDGSVTPTAVSSYQTKGVFTFTIPDNNVNLTEGNHTITFVPVQNVENTAGAKTYQFTYKPSPYVIFTNVYNNQIFDSFTGLSRIQGRLVNVPKEDRTLVEISINGVTRKMQLTDFVNSTDRAMEFSIPVGPGTQFVFNEEGKTTITFKIFTKDNQVTPIAVNSIDIFFFTTQVPDFQYVKPIDKNTPPRFPAGNKPDSYVTSSKTVQLEGQFINASEITLTVRRYDENGVQKVQKETYLSDFSKREGDSRLFNGRPSILSNSPKTVRFTTNTITLSDTGSTFLEFTIRNGGLTTTKTVEIVRQSEVFEIVKPNLNFSHVVNTNILEVQLIAEGADQVVYNKLPAIKQEIIDRDGNRVPGFVFRTKELKPNKDNKITFEVIRGAETFKGEFTVFFAEKAVPGAQYWTKLESTIYAFNKSVQMKVPKGTVLRRNDWKGEDFYLTPERDIVIAIAEQSDGRVDRERQDNPDGKIALTEPTGRFSPASPLYWIDAGTVSANEQDANISIRGRGQLPYEGDYFFRRNPADVMVPITNDKPVTLTLQYDENIRQGAWSYVTVYHFDYVEDHMGIKQWRWTNMGGVVDPKKHTITVPIKNFGFYQVMYMGRSFDDVINHPWGRDYLDTMYSKGYMKNVRDNEFGPNEPITRGEFATILVKSFEIPLDYEGGATFSDVQRVNPASRGLYDYKYIETAARAGIVRGGTGGRFYPDSPITREDAAVMIARAGDYKLDSALKAKPKAQKAYTDANIISEYALPSVMAVAKVGIMEGKLRAAQQGIPESYYYDPRGNLTRAESAAIAMRVLQGAKKIPKQ